MSVLIIVIFTLALCAVGDFKSINPLVFGGKRTTIEEAPFMAIYMNIASEFRVSCGASIISERFVLSAAHCYVPECRYYVIVGTDIFTRGQRFNIEKTIIHPKYNNITLDYDVLVVKLRDKLEFGAKVQAIKMADSKIEIPNGAILDVFGFGVTENGFSSKYLRRVRVPYLTQEKCRSAHGNELTDSMICAGKEGKDSCEGDSGGPLVYNNVLVGVVSFGVECGQSEFLPGVYASVSKVRKFIDNVIREM